MAVVLVTGGSSGIGRATVARLVAAGDRVFSLARRPCPIDGATSLTMDLRDRAAGDDAVARVLADAGRIDAVVNNAGFGPLGPIEEQLDDVVDHVFDVNVFAPLRLARAALPAMRAQGSGRIVNVTSMNDVMPAPFGGHYSASKAALATASTVLGAEVASFGVRVTVVSPGLFLTEMAEALGRHDVDPASPYAGPFGAVIAASPDRLPGAGDPDDVAAAIELAIRSDDPPARIVVGDDARSFADLVASVDAEGLAAILRDFVTGLSSGGS